ncbi:hypothetical protein OKW39_002671 [Paraburkholderia sp. MM6662-R1]
MRPAGPNARLDGKRSHATVLKEASAFFNDKWSRHYGIFGEPPLAPRETMATLFPILLP